MTAPMTREELLEIAAAGVRHAVGISAQLERSDWMPRRAHIEQARNTIQKLAGLLVDPGNSQQPWQPIETARLDGKPFLARYQWLGQDHMMVIRRSDKGPWWILHGTTHVIGQKGSAIEFTDWQQLPAPPSNQGASK